MSPVCNVRRVQFWRLKAENNKFKQMSIRSKRKRWQSGYSFRPRENNANFSIIQDERRWDQSPSYHENERGGWPTDEGRYRPSETMNPNRYQYYGGQEDYPGPSRLQGFSGNERYGRR